MTLGGCSTDGLGLDRQRTERSVTQGFADVLEPTVFDCPAVPDARDAPVGRITSSDGRTWTTPTDVRFSDGPRLDDLYNECTGVRPAGPSDVDVAALPITEIDTDGDVITGYLFGDNYFELFVNGTLVGVDPVPYTPFNSTVVRFRAKRPISYAVKLVDWEENAGLGTERLGADPWHAGDAGFVASFSDGTVTDDSWRAQTFSIAPLSDPADVVERGNVHDSSAAGPSGCADRCFAVHYPVPTDWAAAAFDDSDWPTAKLYTEAQVGVSYPAYQNFREQFVGGGAQFIWTSNLVKDNVVLARTTSP